ncbi:MAG: phosphoribosyltransferase family protein [Thermofilaceae archaeon]
MRTAELTWSDVLGLSLTVAEEVRRERIDAVVAVLRGGIYPALIIAARLNIDRVYEVEFRRYSDEKPPREIHGEPLLLRDSVPQLNGERVLVVDDVARTGLTLKAARELLISKGAGEVKTAVLVVRSREMVEVPDYYAIFMTSCPVFPWERYESEEG